MGRTARDKPRRLATKLLRIRRSLGFTQAQMWVALKLNKTISVSAISGYELGTREPSLPVLLRYAQLAGLSTDLLIDDKLDLPK